jgi:hypothetical protein
MRCQSRNVIPQAIGGGWAGVGSRIFYFPGIRRVAGGEKGFEVSRHAIEGMGHATAVLSKREASDVYATSGNVAYIKVAALKGRRVLD